jgi:hypothetical protein
MLPFLSSVYAQRGKCCQDISHRGFRTSPQLSQVDIINLTQQALFNILG